MAASDADPAIDGEFAEILAEWDEVTVSRNGDVGHRDDDCKLLNGHQRTFDTDADEDVLRTCGPLRMCTVCGKGGELGGNVTENTHFNSLIGAAVERHGDDLEVDPAVRGRADTDDTEVSD